MPRSYDMTGRAAAVAETRERIVAAAIAVYAREGFRAASMQSIAREADVAPATVLNHFSTGEQLVAAAAEAITAKLALPDPAALDAIGNAAERVRWLVRELAAFYERSATWYAVYAHDRDLPVLQRASAEFFRRVERLVRAALRGQRADRRSIAVVMAVAGPGTLDSLRAAGMTGRVAADTLADVLVAWLAARRARRNSQTS
jgi:AcrR family transcriptional regulator